MMGAAGRRARTVSVARCRRAAAKENAKQLVDGCDVELWQGSRKIQTFKRKPE